MASYATVPGAETEYGIITAAAGSGGVVLNTFVHYDASTKIATTATTSALNTMIALESGDEGDQVALKFAGLAYLSVNAGTAITTSCSLVATTAGVGIITTTDKHFVSAIALDALASGTGTILVECAHFTLSV